MLDLLILVVGMPGSLTNIEDWMPNEKQKILDKEHFAAHLMRQELDKHSEWGRMAGWWDSGMLGWKKKMKMKRSLLDPQMINIVANRSYSN